MARETLIDSHGRRIAYLRLSVTDRCDLRCRYCRLADDKSYAKRADWLSFAEIRRLVGLFAAMGVGRVRLTGGEPLLRAGIVDLVGELAAAPGVSDLSLSTNATQLARYAARLKAAGLSRVNVSLDSLKRECVSELCGRDSLDATLAGLMAAKAAGLAPIKLNMVALQGVNDGEIESMAAFCFEHCFILRLIEAMPMGEAGRAAAYLPLDEARARLIRRFALQPCAVELGGGPARYWQTADGRGQVGFITPISQHFCASCNRVRLTVDGTLYLCLGQEHKLELRQLLRGGASDDELAAAIRLAVERKPLSHDFDAPGLNRVRFMSKTGG
ncbi:GTP 3',8-cyclase MoaA [Chromobacterium sp. IIBBL 290-4]|uniref:GTP 3',8-cyclase MoaA n=1 Tax=Chromobacterium sp. IIBBL 290-4 TaxID=2953890 RepID=UPI0020B6424F|nr:GTP 3',8-cyclase MoaA [Chromobacterium sp. IIBBL 290-4]UTH73061.1 GTP 3',8-cyclase MoaA [Chromobacterium sp. IIBBL 290-4]